MEERKNYRCNLICIWLDHKKAFDSVPHDWIIKALHLAKVPENVINAIDKLMNVWATRVSLKTENGQIETDFIEFLSGILQGDQLSLILFILSANPLSFLPSKSDGYMMGSPNKRTTKLIHLFFVDDLKMYSENMNQPKQQLDIVTSFSKDIGMQFGLEKCAYVYIERGKRKQLWENITVNNIAIKELKQDDIYKYLGQDEAVTYNGPLNKERVSTEYLRRVRKVWNSQLNAPNKTTAQNVFAVPVLTPTIGILDWSKEEVQQLDIKTRKTMAMAGSLHKRSDVERLYTPRKQGGRGLTSVEDIFTSRTVSLATHIGNNKDQNPFLQKVYEHEQLRLFRVANEFKKYLEVQSQQLAPKQVGQEIRKALRSNHEKNWTDKVTHGYNTKIVKEDSKVNQSLSVKWIYNSTLTSHMEAYMFAIEEQEIVTKATKKRRELDITNRRTMDNKCRICRKQEETLTHILGSCESISESLYLKYRHNQVGKIVYQEFVENNGVKTKHRHGNQKIRSDEKRRPRIMMGQENTCYKQSRT